MTTKTETRSAYPPAIDDLMLQAQALTARLGELPSRNRLKRELHIGPDKAAAVLTALTSSGPETPVSPAGPAPDMAWPPTRPADGVLPLGSVAAYSGTEITTTPSKAGRPVRSWPVVLLALPAFVAVWSGWVGLGGLTGFGIVHPFPGIWDHFQLNTAITLPIGVEAYAAYAIRVWLSPAVSGQARRFAKWSTIAALILGAGGQVAYHLMSAWHMTAAPWPVTTAVASLPVVVVFAGSALAHLVHTDRREH